MKRAIDEIKNRDIRVPWEYGRFIGMTIEISGEYASISNEMDCGTVTEIRAALGWYVEQFGGKVKWEKYE